MMMMSKRGCFIASQVRSDQKRGGVELILRQVNHRIDGYFAYVLKQIVERGTNRTLTSQRISTYPSKNKANEPM